MCGIVGYIGGDQAAPILLSGLQKLEYRGYDSAGVAVYNDGGRLVPSDIPYDAAHDNHSFLFPNGKGRAKPFPISPTHRHGAPISHG